MLTITPQEKKLPYQVGEYTALLDNEVKKLPNGLHTYDVEIPYLSDSITRDEIVVWYLNFGWLNVSCILENNYTKLHIESPLY